MCFWNNNNNRLLFFLFFEGYDIRTCGVHTEAHKHTLHTRCIVCPFPLSISGVFQTDSSVWEVIKNWGQRNFCEAGNLFQSTLLLMVIHCTWSNWVKHYIISRKFQLRLYLYLLPLLWLLRRKNDSEVLILLYMKMTVGNRKKNHETKKTTNNSIWSNRKNKNPGKKKFQENPRFWY